MPVKRQRGVDAPASRDADRACGAALRAGAGRRELQLLIDRGSLREENRKLDLEHCRKGLPPHLKLPAGARHHLLERKDAGARGADDVQVEAGGVAQTQTQRLRGEQLPGA